MLGQRNLERELVESCNKRIGEIAGVAKARAVRSGEIKHGLKILASLRVAA